MWGEWCENGYPERRLHTARRQTRMPGRHQRKIFAPPIGTATPNTVYTQQAAKPARQEDTNAKCSHLLWAQLPRTTFTHSKLPNPHARKTPTQNFRTSYWHSYPEHSLHTARRQTRMPGRHHRNMFASPIGRATPNDVCTQQRHLHTASCQTISRGSEYCACHTDSSRSPRRPGAPQPFLEVLSTAPATQTGAAAHGDQARRNPFWRLQVLRLPHRQEPRPTATRGAATLSGTSKYCACHTDRSRGPRRPGAPQPFLEAPNTGAQNWAAST